MDTVQILICFWQILSVDHIHEELEIFFLGVGGGWWWPSQVVVVMVEVESGREGGGSAGHGNGGSCSGLNIEEDEATLMR